MIDRPEQIDRYIILYHQRHLEVGRKRVRHEEPLTTIHIKSKTYDFVTSQKKRGEPLYQTMDRIINEYQEAIEELSTFKEVYRRNFQEKLQLQQKLDKFMENKDIPQPLIETSDP